MKWRLQPDDPGKGSLLFVAAVFLLSIAHGCAPREAIERARARGADAGQNDGQRAGEAEGFRIAFKEAETRSYHETLSQLYSSGDYSRRPFIELPVLVSFFVLGYAFQYGVLYVLRASGFLTDIDWIVLAPEAIEKLKSLSGQQSQVTLTREQTRLIPRNPDYGQGSS